jgi:hypothetical protein
VSAHADEVTERITAAMRSANADDIVAGVKAAVADEIGALSPDVSVVFTPYFNHTYMPDLMVEWSDAGKQSARPIFLRTTLKPAAREVDVESLAQREPVLLSLSRPEVPQQRMDTLRARTREAPRVLVTDVGSLAEIAAPELARPSEAPPLARAAAPLLRLVQTNLLKGGRGLLTTEDAQRLASAAAPSGDEAQEGLTEQFLMTFEESVDELFAPDAALRLRRSAELLRFGLARDAIPDLALTAGELSDVELRVLLPYLLADPSAQTNGPLWEFVGGMMSLERLEDMWDVLAGVDVSPLVVANASRWTAKRSQLVINAQFDSEESVAAPDGDEEATDQGAPGVGEVEPEGPSDESMEPVIPFWEVSSNKMLRAESGPWLLFVTTDGRRLRGRTGSRAARWEDIIAPLSAFTLDAVELRGVSRRIAVTAEESGDVSADVRRISDTIEDSFRVTEVNVRKIGEEAGMTVDFTEMSVTASPRASIEALVTASALLGYRNPPDFAPLVDTASRAVADGSESEAAT